VTSVTRETSSLADHFRQEAISREQEVRVLRLRLEEVEADTAAQIEGLTFVQRSGGLGFFVPFWNFIFCFFFATDDTRP
jgi:hypothetical protein